MAGVEDTAPLYIATWGAAIREYRRRRGLTQAGFAAEFGVHMHTVHRYERGRYRPRPGSLLERTLRSAMKEAGIVVVDVRSR